MFSLPNKPMRSGKAEYYLNPAEDYYMSEGHGRWWGDGAEELGLSGQVEGQSFRSILDGYLPEGKKLVQNAGSEGHRAGWDGTFSDPKSVSVINALCQDSWVREQINLSRREALNASLSYIQDNAAWVRVGHGGSERRQCSLAVAVFEHTTSRAIDPDLHSHCIITNIGVWRDDKGELRTTTLDPRPIYQHKMAAGAVYRAELAMQLEQRLGVEIQRAGSFFQIKGVPEDLCREFSKRRVAIEEALLSRGVFSQRAADIASLETRQLKEHRSKAELFSMWEEVGQKHGFTRKEILSEVLFRVRPERVLETEKKEALYTALERLTSQQSHFAERDLMRFVAEESQWRGIGAAHARSIVNAWTSGNLKLQQKDHEAVLLPQKHGEERFTTREVMKLEERLLSQVKTMHQNISHQVFASSVRGVIAEREVLSRLPMASVHALSDEQKRALRHVTRESGAISIVSGMAGTGKTEFLSAVRSTFEREKYEVFGACISAKAARGLENGSGIKSTTVASVLMRLDKAEESLSERAAGNLKGAALGFYNPKPLNLTSRSVLVIDEAGMVGTREMARLVSACDKSGAKLICVGDHRQLQPIGMGAPFRAMAERVGVAELKDIKRQSEKWQVDAIQEFSRSNSYKALMAYESRGYFTTKDNRFEARHALIQAWEKEGVKKPHENLIFAGEKVEVQKLNRLAQEARLREGKLEGPSITVEGNRFYSGDRVLFTKNSYQRGVQNGDLGTVVGVSHLDQNLMVKLDDTGERVRVPLLLYKDISLGYSMTCHKAQGITCKNSYVLAAGPLQDAEITYVQASRARHETHFFADQPTKDLIQEMSRSRQKELAHDLLPKQKEHHTNQQRL